MKKKLSTEELKLLSEAGQITFDDEINYDENKVIMLYEILEEEID
jgi:hypothetical protein